jgi:hypothetical protein
MSSGRATQPGKGERNWILVAKIATIASVPLVLFAYHSDPPAGVAGAPGQGTCAECHGTLTAGSGVAVVFPSMTYTPGGAAESWTVNVPTGPGGFELTTRVLSDNSQAGTLTAGTNSDVATSGSFQYARQWQALHRGPSNGPRRRLMSATSRCTWTGWAQAARASPVGRPSATCTL